MADDIEIYPTNCIRFDQNTPQKSVFIHNNTSRTVAFIVQTTTPEIFNVKPSAGLIGPNKKFVVLLGRKLPGISKVNLSDVAFKVDVYNYYWLAHSDKEDIKTHIRASKMVPLKGSILKVEERKIPNIKKRDNVDIGWYLSVGVIGIFSLLLALKMVKL